MTNPYLNRSMLRNGGDFFGREKELHGIYMRITQRPPQSCSVVGLRRIGKSSLLYHLSKKRGGFPSYLPPDQDNLYCIYYDLQPERSITIQRFFGKLRRKAMKALGDIASDLSVELECDSEDDAFETMAERASEGGCSLVFFFDEFDGITKNRNFDEQFFGQLRHIANTYNVAFVTSSQEPLSKLCHTEEIAQSPFFNIFTKVDLQLLAEKEALALISEPAGTQGVHFTDREIALVLELGGFHPFFIQIACSHLFELKRARGQAILSDTDFDHIRGQFLAEATDHYDYCLGHLSDDRERSALCAIATSLDCDTVASEMASEVDALRKKGLIIQQRGQFSPFSFSFREFLQSLPAIPTTDTRKAAMVTDEEESLSNGPAKSSYDSKVWDTIILLEKRFRLLLKQRFENRWLENWEHKLEECYPHMYQDWIKKQQKDTMAFLPYERADIILDYAYLDELGCLIGDDWNFFRKVFEFRPGQGKANKQALHQKIEDIVRVRNPLAHGRSVPDTELRRAHVSCDDLNNQIDKSGVETNLAKSHA